MSCSRSSFDSSTRLRPVTFVGAGPGNPDLVTRRGWALLGQADVILHDALLDVEGFKQAAPQARWIDVGKREGRLSTDQNFISRTLVSLALRGDRVVRLKGGDVAIFGRLTEEIQACRAAGLEVQIVPGVTAASSSAAELGISLTQREVARSVTFLTPRTSGGGRCERWLDSAMASDTLVLYMAGREWPGLAAQLIAHGKSPQTPLACVESSSLGGTQWLGRLGDCIEQSLPLGDGPVTIIVGEVVDGSVCVSVAFGREEKTYCQEAG